MQTWLQRACKNWKKAISNPCEDINFVSSYAAVLCHNEDSATETTHVEDRKWRHSIEIEDGAVTGKCDLAGRTFKL